MNIPLRCIPTMQHISGRKSLIGNPKSMTVLSNTGTMHFIIWGFVGSKGSGQIYLFPSSTSDSSSKFDLLSADAVFICELCLQHAPRSLTTFWPAYIPSYKKMAFYMLRTMHHVDLTAMLFSVLSVGRLSSLPQWATVGLQCVLKWIFFWCFSPSV